MTRIEPDLCPLDERLDVLIVSSPILFVLIGARMQVTPICVPHSGSVRMLSVAPIAAARSRIIPNPSRPEGTALGSKPRPSSQMDSSTSSRSRPPGAMTLKLALLPGDGQATAQAHSYAAGLRVLDHVIERFLGNTIQRNMDIGRQITAPLNCHLDRHAFAPRHCFCQLMQQILQAGLLPGPPGAVPRATYASRLTRHGSTAAVLRQQPAFLLRVTGRQFRQNLCDQACREQRLCNSVM